jgi:hypothetical protein
MDIAVLHRDFAGPPNLAHTGGFTEVKSVAFARRRKDNLLIDVRPACPRARAFISLRVGHSPLPNCLFPVARCRL